MPTCTGPLRTTITALASNAFPASSPHARPCTFDAASLGALRKACKAEQKRVTGTPGTLLRALQLQALSDHARLGLRQVQVAARAQHLRDRAHTFVRPGARAGNAVAVSLGVEVGLPGAVSLGTRFNAGTGGIRTCFETLEYAEGSENSAGVSAHVNAGVPGIGLGLSAQAAFGATRTHYDGALTPEEFAQVRARECVAAPLHARWLQRLRSVINPARRCPVDRIAEAARAARRWEPLMLALLGDSGTGASVMSRLPNEAMLPAPAPMLDVWIKGKTAQLSANARLAAFDAGVQYGRARQAVALEVPCWLPTTRLDEEERSALELSLRQKLEADLGGTAWFANVLSLDPGDIALRLHWLEQLRAEFDHLRQLRTSAELGTDRKTAREVLARFCAQWNGGNLQTTLQRMLELVHWFALSTAGNGQASCPVGEAAAALAEDIRSSPALRQDVSALRKVHACIHMYQHFRTHLAQASVAAELPGITPGAAIQLAHTRQHNYNPLRAGDYVEASLSLSGAVEATALWRTLQQRVPALAETHMPGDLGILLHEAIENGFSAGATATVTLRFFKADFQDETDFDAASRGMHLQQVTFRSAVSFGADATVPLPVAGPAALTAGVSVLHQRARPLREDVFCSGTLTALLLRYQSLLGQGLAPETAWQSMRERHAGSLERLADALASPKGTARAEATYWLGKACRNPAEVPWTSLAFTPADPLRPAPHAAARQACDPAVSGHGPSPLQALLDDVLRGVDAVQKRSPMRSPLQLHGAQMKMPDF